MTRRPAESGLAQNHVETRRARILRALPHRARSRDGGSRTLPRGRAEFLLDEARNLYWNELSWEEITDEERVSGGYLTEMVFSAFLAFVDGLLPERPSPVQAHPDVAEEILAFLGERYASLTADLEAGADSGRVVRARALTAGLIDLVLYRVYHLTPAEREALEAGT